MTYFISLKPSGWEMQTLAPKNFFLKCGIIPHSITVLRSNIKPLDWDLEIQHREQHQIKRTERERKKAKTVTNYTEGERVVIQDDIRKNWTRHGTVLSEERGNDSYQLLLDHGREFIHHRKHIRRNQNTDEMIAQKLRKYMEKRDSQYQFADTALWTAGCGKLRSSRYDR